MPAPAAASFPARPRLLVSVVDADEAREALRGGAHVIDAKDPSRGAMGALPAAALRAILDALPAGTPSSAALGEARDLWSGVGAGAGDVQDAPQDAPEDPPGRSGAWPASASACPAGLSYVKVALGGCAEEGAALRALDAVRRALGSRLPGPALIVAAYADHERAGSLPPQALPAVASRAGAHGCLLDTAVKDGSCLFEWIDERALAGIVAECRARGLLCALAGSLRLEHLARLAALGPDLIGVRGAACDGDRARGRVRAARVAALSGALSLKAGAPTAPRR